MGFAAALVLAMGAIGVALVTGVGLTRPKVAAAATVTPIVPKYPAGWTHYVAPDSTYDVVGPGTPVARTHTSVNGPVAAVRFSDASARTFLVESFTLPSTLSSKSETAALTAVQQQLLRGLIGQTADEEQLSDAGHPGSGISVALNGVSYDLRVFIASGRVYEVLATKPESDTSRAPKTFVDSFGLLGASVN